MDAQRWRLVTAAFESALDLPIERREAWLERLDRLDPDLVAEVRRMLDEHARVEHEHFLVDSHGESPGVPRSPDSEMQATRPEPTEFREPRPSDRRSRERGDQESSAIE